MRETKSYLYYAVLLIFLWTTCLLKLCYCNYTDCNFEESYDEVVMVSVKEPVIITKYKWCMKIPPRCPENKKEFRVIHKNITVSKRRIVRKCCEDQIRLYNKCIPKCTENQCPNIQCTPGTNNCICMPGYIGYLCEQRCDVGYWGSGCENTCNKACFDCDHRTGCCNASRTNYNRATMAGLTFCATGSIVAHAGRQTSHDPERKIDSEPGDGTRVKQWFRTRSSPTVPQQELSAREAETQAATTTAVQTQKPALVVTGNQQPVTEESAAAITGVTSSSSKKRENGGTYVHQTLTTMEVKVYNYDELVKKLIWISSMTVIAISMVFIVMFVVFFNCNAVTRVPDTIKPRRPISATSSEIHETCMTTQNLGLIPPDRYSKNPELQTFLAKNKDLPIHPEIFRPVFSAPHYTNTGSSLYDSPQPLYEILC